MRENFRVFKELYMQTRFFPGFHVIRTHIFKRLFDKDVYQTSFESDIKKSNKSLKISHFAVFLILSYVF